MSELQLAFLMMLIVGGGFLVFSLLVGEVSDFIGDQGDASGNEGPGWTSPSVIAGFLCAYGLTGFIASRSGLHGILAFGLGAAVGLVVAFGMITFLRTLARQQGNSQLSNETYLGLTAVVTLSIPPGGKGEVQFRDKNGVLVRKVAASTWAQTMPVGTETNIKTVLADHVVVSRT